MLNPQNIIDQFVGQCTACGLCVEVCPIAAGTALKDVAPETIMAEVLDLFRDGKIGALARTRIYSCLFCNTCLTSCPQGLNPGLAFGTGKGVLQISLWPRNHKFVISRCLDGSGGHMAPHCRNVGVRHHSHNSTSEGTCRVAQGSTRDR